MSAIHYRLVKKALSQIEGGHLQIHLPDQSIDIFGNESGSLGTVNIYVYQWDVFRLVLSRGDIGFAEAYIDGLWTTDQLEEVLRLALKNRQKLEPLFYGSKLGSLLYKIKHFFRRNTRSGSKKNIHAHYDLGNDFYKLWLDKSMMYSSGLFKDENTDLNQAQQYKCERILQMLQLKPNETVLEIGCGWGSFIKRALANQLNVIGLTISTEQKKYIEQNFASPTISIRLQDYRDCFDQVDGIASIEMFEAVGESYWNSYFQTIERCLKAGKRAVIQTIVIRDDLFERYRHETDFIQQYVFPGGMLPSKRVFVDRAIQAGLMVKDAFSFGEDYAKTLRLWRESFNAKLDKIRSLGFDESFIRLWNFYLMYCAAGFAEKSIDVTQFTLEKPSK